MGATPATTSRRAASSSPRTTTAPVGVARDRRAEHGASHVHLVYVRPRARRQGVAKALLRACVARRARARARDGLARRPARRTSRRATVWRRLGFEERRDRHGGAARRARARLAERRAGRVARVDARAERRRASRSSARSRSSCRGSRRRASATQRAAGSGSPTRCSTATARRTARFARELSERLGAVTVALALERARSCASASTSAAAWSTSTSRCRRTTASCRRATSSRSRRTRRSSRGSPAPTATRCGASRAPRRRRPSCRRRAELYEQLARLMGLEP